MSILTSHNIGKSEHVPDFAFLLKLTSPQPQSQGYFGSSCLLTNTSIIIGEPGLYSRTRTEGAVHFFDYNGTLTMTLKTPISGNQSKLGYAIVACEDKLLIGDPGISVSGIESAGMVHIYTIEGEYIRSITSDHPSLNGEFGRALASNNDIIIIGESGPQIFDENVTSRVHIYDKNVNYMFTIQQSEARSGCFGMSLAVNNDTIIVGEPYLSDGMAGWQGIVYMYDLDGKLRKNITSPLHASTMYPRNFGYRISANDNLIAIGEVRGHVDEHEAAGRAYIFDRNGKLLANLTSLRPITQSGFGHLLVWRDMILVEDQVRVDEFPERLGAVLYDQSGELVSVVMTKKNEWVKGYPIGFNDDYIVLGDILGASGGIKYAGNVYVVNVPDEIWISAKDMDFVGSNQLIFQVLISLFLLILILGAYLKREDKLPYKELTDLIF